MQANLIDECPKELSCSKGIPSNLFEFVRYSLGQRQTNETPMKSYDQSYWLRKNGTYNAAPWVVSFGPVSIMTLTHCCSSQALFERNIVDFCQHLSHYGIQVSAHEVPKIELGTKMMSLGLILDSPDAEGGMMIRTPFSKNE